MALSPPQNRPPRSASGGRPLAFKRPPRETPRKSKGQGTGSLLRSPPPFQWLQTSPRHSRALFCQALLRDSQEPRTSRQGTAIRARAFQKDLLGKASGFSPLRTTVPVSSSRVAFIRLKFVPPVLKLVRFYHAWKLNPVECRFCTLAGSRDLSPSFCYVMCHVRWLAYGEAPLHLGGESHSIEVGDGFNVLQSPVGWNFVARCCIRVRRGCWPAVSSPCGVLFQRSYLVSGRCWPHENEFDGSLLFNFWGRL